MSTIVYFATTWNCKYHIVFAPKYRRRVFFGDKRKGIGAILRQLCEWNNGSRIFTILVICFDRNNKQKIHGAVWNN